MAIIKCKMCGGDLNLIEGASTAECEFCGSMQTIPNLDDEKKLIQFERAERLRKQCEFDKAAGIYETIVADFRQEAEAYWGLVLCKYGIEYVDDPATGKKIPTCHRSSFDSIMEDSDFEQALENADVMARRVYREEAKQIEEIRKGIIAVSANEEPYDIFICYKETTENGDRTLDSVLAQDVYDALTDKGYRVFFSRISLEDKLGMEYEPYIFAALNSAKIMLAFGTDYEYFNAVWVKNEWSRFLKLMASDKSKHLIPCYKGIDAYDMPSEFVRLQAQDLGKIGAIQDLVRGIEKLLPRRSETVAEENIVVQQAINGNAAALLKRGNIALEDGAWEDANGFFNQVLNIEPECAHAYLGFVLAKEQTVTLADFVKKYTTLYKPVVAAKQLPVDVAMIEERVKTYSIPQFLSQNAIRKAYIFNTSYQSCVDSCEENLNRIQTLLNKNKNLSRAVRFEKQKGATTIAEAVRSITDTYTTALENAKRNAEKAIEEVNSRYQAYIDETDSSIQLAYRAALEKRNEAYVEACTVLDNSESVGELQAKKTVFDNLNGYLESTEKAKQCSAKIQLIQERIRQEKKALLEQKKSRSMCFCSKR